MEYECGLGEDDFPYIDTSIKDSRGLITVLVAAVNSTTEVNIPNVQLPLSGLESDNGRKLRIFTANYSFSKLNLCVVCNIFAN